MASQVENADASLDYFDVLYDDDVEYEWDGNEYPVEVAYLEESDVGEIVKIENENDHDQSMRFSPSVITSSPIARHYSPPNSPMDRSRSPLGSDSSSSEDIEPGVYEVQNNGELFMVPEAHYVFGGMCDIDMVDESDMTNERDDEGGNRIGVRVRGRGRGRSGFRGCRQGRSYRRGGRRGGTGGRAPHWRVGDPIQIIWTDDDDVPAALREMVTDVVRKREERRTREFMAKRNAYEKRASKVNESENDDTFYDAEDGDDLLAGGDLNFEWSADMETFQKKEVPFKPKRTGAVKNFTTSYDAFRSFWGNEILDTVVEQTNLYAEKIDSASFKRLWVPTNAHEILCLFAFWMMLGIIRMPTIKSCFSDEALLKVNVFKKIFKPSRYANLVRALHFVEADSVAKSFTSASMSGPEAADRMHSLRPIIDHLNAKFQANYILSKDISIDESLTLWKGSLDIKQYIRTKSAKFGIKTYELCEAATGYLWSFIVYTGTHSNPDLPNEPSMLKSSAVVRRLMSPLLNKGYRLFMDNWYNSPLLARWLKINGTDCVGTLRSTRSDVPPIIHHAQLKQGQLIARHSGDVCVAAWQDKKKVVTISTCHGTETGFSKVLSKRPSRPMPFKPQVILDYNRNMGGVDLKDQMLEPYLLERKRGSKWHMKLFKRLLNCSIQNARILMASSTQKTQNPLVFRLSLVNSILLHHLHKVPLKRRETSHINIDPTRITTNTHWPVHHSQMSADAVRNRKTQKNCSVCLKGKKIKRTAFKCDTCNVPLCVENCFKLYHTSSYI